MILAIDTATRWTGLALHDGRTVLAEHGWRSVNNQTVELAPAVADMMRHTGLAPSDLAAVAVAIGPGSYTGLRIGLGFAKGLAVANQVRLIGVPTLDIVAAGQPWAESNLVVIAEAGRTRVCAGTYSWRAGKGWISEAEPIIAGWDELLASIEEPVTFAGEITPASAKLIRAAGKKHNIVPAANAVRRAGFLAEIGWQRLRRGWTDDPSTLAPIYLRDPAGEVKKSD